MDFDGDWILTSGAVDRRASSVIKSGSVGRTAAPPAWDGQNEPCSARPCRVYRLFATRSSRFGGQDRHMKGQLSRMNAGHSVARDLGDWVLSHAVFASQLLVRGCQEFRNFYAAMAPAQSGYPRSMSRLLSSEGKLGWPALLLTAWLRATGVTASKEAGQMRNERLYVIKERNLRKGMKKEKGACSC